MCMVWWVCVCVFAVCVFVVWRLYLGVNVVRVCVSVCVVCVSVCVCGVSWGKDRVSVWL